MFGRRKWHRNADRGGILVEPAIQPLASQAVGRGLEAVEKILNASAATRPGRTWCTHGLLTPRNREHEAARRCPGMGRRGRRSMADRRPKLASIGCESWTAGPGPRPWSSCRGPVDQPSPSPPDVITVRPSCHLEYSPHASHQACRPSGSRRMAFVPRQPGPRPASARGGLCVRSLTSDHINRRDSAASRPRIP